MNKKTQYNQIGKSMTMLGLSLAFSISAMAQSTVVKGNVTDENGEPMVGASVRVKGTNTGATTDANGNFTLNVKQGASLQVSYIGYNSTTISATGENLSISLVPNDSMLDEAVVIGYGTQKKSVVTAAIAKISADDLEGKTPVRMDNALKGLAAGVNVTSSSGQPGSSPKIRIRGTGTINNSDPLYIVDGMPIEGGFDYINPNDIESIEVLKDAASGAIYGARAANGVVLVTTKKGKVGKTRVTYDFSYGWQSAWRKRNVTDATNYAILQNERAVNGGQAPIFADPYNLKDIMGNPITTGTDWQSLVFNDNAPVMNHDVTFSGASEKVNYYASVGYYTQDGIVGGNYGHSNYDRLTIRNNNIYTLLDTQERNFLNKVVVTTNLSYAYVKSTGISTNSEYGSILGSALYLAPTLTPTVTGSVAQDMINHYVGYDLLCDQNGDPYTIPGYGGSYQEMNNPLAMLALPASQNWSHKFVANFKLEIGIWDGLKFQTSFSPDMSFWGNDGKTSTLYYLSGNNKAEHTSASASKSQGLAWQWENVLSYDKIFGKHTLGIVLGQSAFRNQGSYLSGNRWNLVNPDKASIDYATGTVVDGVAQFGVSGGFNTEHRVSSLFARASYNYDERYMLQATVRRDGSSRFGTNNRYGVFPSASIGWNVTNEKFFEPIRDKFSLLKLRASWGVNGSDAIGDFLYTVNTAMGNNVLFGKDAVINVGSKASGLANPDLKWEESEQFNAGVDFGWFNNALTLTVEYFRKNTNGMILQMPIPSYVGESKPYGNVGDMRNQGIEFELGFKKQIGDVRLAIKGNASYLKNELVNLGNESGYVEYDGVQGISGGSISRGSNGLPFPYFYGYKTAGVYQTEAEAAAGVTYKGQANHAGDVIFVDVNGDGDITPDDRTKIGKGTPDWNFGLNFNLDWKGFDFNLFLQGVAGAEVADCTYRTDVFSGNYPNWMLGRWTGPGTSNKYPILKAGDEKNWQFSDLYIYDGSYCRVKNVSIGYTLPESLTKKIMMNRFRVYAMAENLFTWTKYHGFDPEISSNGKSSGVDRGIYPQARTFTVGCNISFGGYGNYDSSNATAANTYRPVQPEVVERVVEKVVEKPVEKIVEKIVEKEVVKDGGLVQNTYVVTFPVNSSKIENTAELDGIKKGSKVEVVGYASPEGNVDVNLALSQQRADAVAEYLKARGVDVVRVNAKGADTNHANRIAIITVK